MKVAGGLHSNHCKVVFDYCLCYRLTLDNRQVKYLNKLKKYLRNLQSQRVSSLMTYQPLDFY